jgi:hypothetical protein
VIDLDKVCGGPAAALTLDQLHQRCTHYGAAFAGSGGKIVFAIVAGVLVGLFVLLRRVKKREDRATVVLNTLEGLLYGALGGWFGASAGALLALLLPHHFFGAMLAVFALLAVLVMIGALVTGSGGGIKAVGVLSHLSLAGILVAAAAFAFAVPGNGRAGDAFEGYAIAASLAFATTGFLGALMAALFRGYHGGVGWLLVPVNASWGALGNLLGLMNHLACLLYFKDYGGVQETRRWYVRYDAGFHLKANYDFTEGDAMSANRVESHEAVHVLQHFIAGPIYPLSHAAWVATMFLPGLIAGAIAKHRTVAEGITDFTYFNNPWEVMAYGVAGRRNDGAADQPLVFNEVAAWIVSIVWILLAIGGLIGFLASRP